MFNGKIDGILNLINEKKMKILNKFVDFSHSLTEKT